MKQLYPLYNSRRIRMPAAPRRSPWPARGITTVSAIAAIILIGGCSEKIQPGNTSPATGPALAVPVTVVKNRIQPLTYDAVGTVKAKLSTTVSSQLMGVIREIRVKEGDTIKRGELLVVQDDRQVAAQLSQARAALSEAQKAQAAALSARDAAKAGARRALLSYERNQKMLKGDAITQETFENVEAQYKQAKAALSQAVAMVEAARFRVHQARAAMDAAAVAHKDARILAPFDGEVTAKLTDTGALAAPGTPLLTLERKGGYRVDLVVPEAYIGSVRTGQAVAVRIPAIGDAPVDGMVNVIIPSADPGSRTFIVQVGLADTVAARSGMFARVPLTIGRQASMRIPLTAVVREGQLTGVYMVDAKDIARFRLIRTGRAFGERVEVISGLEDGTRLVAAPPPQLANGSAVEPEQ